MTFLYRKAPPSLSPSSLLLLSASPLCFSAPTSHRKTSTDGTSSAEGPIPAGDPAESGTFFLEESRSGGERGRGRGRGRGRERGEGERERGEREGGPRRRTFGTRPTPVADLNTQMSTDATSASRPSGRRGGPPGRSLGLAWPGGSACMHVRVCVRVRERSGSRSWARGMLDWVGRGGPGQRPRKQC